jgi:hypothetical protein
MGRAESFATVGIQLQALEPVMKEFIQLNIGTECSYHPGYQGSAQVFRPFQNISSLFLL